jgi:hypothetical protein
MIKNLDCNRKETYMPQSIIHQGNNMDIVKAWMGMNRGPKPFRIGLM